jgi:hypothetical protein
MIEDYVVHYQALIREVINGSAMVLCMSLTIMIGVFMWDSIALWVTHKIRGPGKRGNIASTGLSWHEVPGIQTACALWWIFLAESYRTGAVWLLYNMGKAQKESGIFFGVGGFYGSSAYWSSYGYLCAGVVLNAGLLRAIFIFTPPEWKNRVWIYASIGAVVFCSAPALYNYFTRI